MDASSRLHGLLLYPKIIKSPKYPSEDKVDPIASLGRKKIYPSCTNNIKIVLFSGIQFHVSQ
jgi:hypothetical protein